MLRRIAAIVVIVALISTGAYFLIDYSSTDEILHFDDYIESPEAVSATGSLEITTLYDKVHIHAIKIGKGSVTFEDGSKKTYTVQKAQLDVYLLLGQSNAAYDFVGDVIDSTKTIPGTAYVYGVDEPAQASSYNEDVKKYSSLRSMNNSAGEQYIGNIEAPLAASLHDQTGNKILVVNGAVSGTAIATHLPGAINCVKASAVFNDAIDSINKNHFDYTVKSYIWIQGEYDKATPVGTYVDSFLAIHDNLTKEDGLFSDHKFDAGFLSLIVADKPAVAQSILASTFDNIVLGSVSAWGFSLADGTLMDNVHYSQLGDNILGADLSKSIVEYYSTQEV